MKMRGMKKEGNGNVKNRSAVNGLLLLFLYRNETTKYDRGGRICFYSAATVLFICHFVIICFSL